MQSVCLRKKKKIIFEALFLEFEKLMLLQQVLWVLFCPSCKGKIAHLDAYWGEIFTLCHYSEGRGRGHVWLF